MNPPTRCGGSPPPSRTHTRSRRLLIKRLLARASRGRRRRPCERVRGMSEVAKRPSESAGEGVANWCPAVARSSRSHDHHTRTRANRLGRVWPNRARRSHGRLGYPTTVHVRARIGPRGRGSPVPGCCTVASVAVGAQLDLGGRSSACSQVTSCAGRPGRPARSHRFEPGRPRGVRPILCACSSSVNDTTAR